MSNDDGWKNEDFVTLILAGIRLKIYLSIVRLD